MREPKSSATEAGNSHNWGPSLTRVPNQGPAEARCLGRSGSRVQFGSDGLWLLVVLDENDCAVPNRLGWSGEARRAGVIYQRVGHHVIAVRRYRTVILRG